MSGLKKILGVSILLCVTSFAHAQGYVGLNYATISEEADGLDLDIDYSAWYVRSGYQFNEWIALEVRYGAGLSTEKFILYGTDGTYELDSFYGGYVVTSLPTNSRFSPYLVLGYSRGEAKVSVTAFGYSETVSSSESDVSYGAGVNFDFNERVAMNLEVTRYSDKDGSLDGLSLGLKASF